MRRSAADPRASAAIPASAKSSNHREIDQLVLDGHMPTKHKFGIRPCWREDKPLEDGYRRKSSRLLLRSLQASSEDGFMLVPSNRVRVGSNLPHRDGIHDGEVDGAPSAGEVGALQATSPLFVKSIAKRSAWNAPATTVAPATVSSDATLFWNAAVASQLQEILLQHNIQPNTAASIISTCMQNGGLTEAAASGEAVIRPSPVEAIHVVTKAATVDGEVIGGRGSASSPSTSVTCGSEYSERRKSPEGFTKFDGFAKLHRVDLPRFAPAAVAVDDSMVDADERTIAAPIYKPKSRLLAAAIADGAVTKVTTAVPIFSVLKTTTPLSTAVTSSSPPTFVTASAVCTPVVTCTSSSSSKPYTWDAASMTGGGLVCDLTATNTVASSDIVANPSGASTLAGAFLMASMRAKNASSPTEAGSPASMFVMPTSISATSTNVRSSSRMFGCRQTVPPAAAPICLPATKAAGASVGDVEVKHATAETLDAKDVVLLRCGGSKDKSSGVRTKVAGSSSTLPNQPHEQLHSSKFECPSPCGALADTFITTIITTTVSVRPSDGQTRTSTETVSEWSKSSPSSAVATPGRDTYSKSTLKRTASQPCDGLSLSVPLASSIIYDPIQGAHSLSPSDRSIRLSAKCAASSSSDGGIVKKQSAEKRGRPRRSESRSAKYARLHRDKMKSYRSKVYDERDRLRLVVANQEAEVIELERERSNLRQRVQHTYLQAPDSLKPKLLMLIS